jgi:alkenylglycerophosphocholine/alkenylglycerophosphoethanolamine hydrolase
VDGLSTGLVLGAVAVAILDWIAVARDDRWTEYVAKPLTMVLLIAAALTLDPTDGTARAWFVVALVCSLAGDVFLMLPRDRFVPGLASFLLGHLAYIVGLRHLGSSVAGLVAGVVVVAVALPLLAPRVLAAIRRSDDPGLAVPVALYIVVISAMVVAAGASGVIVALLAAAAFYASDALIAWTRFVTDLPHGRLLVMTTYHLAQIGFVLALV